MYSVSPSVAAAGFGPDSTLIVARGGEPRCVALPLELSRLGASLIYATSGHGRDDLIDTVQLEGEQIGSRTVPLRDVDALADLFCELSGYLCVDISCLPHAIWAGLLRAAVLSRTEVAACYVEPQSYESVNASAVGVDFDLSLSIGGHGPLPGFSSLSLPGVPSTVVFLLGFEGARVGHMAAALGAEAGHVRAVVGEPGMQEGYDALAIEGNRQALERLGLEVPRQLDRCGAADAMGLVRLLEQIAGSIGAENMTIVPVGPRPQALGAVLFYANRERLAQPTPRIVYDNAVRDPGGSSGAGTLHLYDIKGFLREFSDG